MNRDLPPKIENWTGNCQLAIVRSRWRLLWMGGLAFLLTTIPKPGVLGQGGRVDIGFNPGSGPAGGTVGGFQYFGAIHSMAEDKPAPNTAPGYFIGGEFVSYDGISRFLLARILKTGALDTSFVPPAIPEGEILAILVQSDRKVIISGGFNAVGGVARRDIARLNADGTLDASFTPPQLSLRPIRTIAFHSAPGMAAGIVLSAGYTGGGPPIRLRLSDGTRDTSFGRGTGANSAATIEFMATDPVNGSIFIAPDGFLSYDGVPRFGLAKLKTDGSLDTGYNTDMSEAQTVYAFALQADGKVLLSHHRFRIGGGVGVLRRFLQNGTNDSSFTSPTLRPDDQEVRLISLQSDGKILIGGSFTNVNGTATKQIARLNSNGSLDASFDTTGSISGALSRMILDSEGKALITGSFTHVDGLPRNRIARLTREDPRLYELGQHIPAPTNAAPNLKPDILSTLPAGFEPTLWHSNRLYAVAPGEYTIRWPLSTNPLGPVLDIPATNAWPADTSRYQRHVAGSTAVKLFAAGSPKFNYASNVFSEANITINSGDLTASGGGRSLILLSTGSVFSHAFPIFFQLVQTIPAFDRRSPPPSRSVDVGKAIEMDAAWHDASLGSPLVLSALGQYCTNFYDRVRREGPIFPVNAPTRTPIFGDLLVIGYQKGTNVINPVTGALVSSAVAWPFQPVDFRRRWPTNVARKIVLAGGNPLVLSNLPPVALYVQNNPDAAGFNPNDEHAWVEYETPNKLYALRSDLGTAGTSQPYVLLAYTNAGQPALEVVRVVAQEAGLDFANTNIYNGIAGNGPIGATELLTAAKRQDTPRNWLKDYGVSGPYWRDRKNRLWAKSAGVDGGPTNVVVRYYYPTKSDFYFPSTYFQYFPAETPPTNVPPASILFPWLDLHAGTPGFPQNVTYLIRWPDAVFEMDLAQTLVGGTRQGDPSPPPNGSGGSGDLMSDSVEVIYEESVERGQGSGVLLFDGGMSHTITNSGSLEAFTDIERGRQVFPSLPTSLRPRLWHGVINRTLNLDPLLWDAGSEPMLLLSVLSPRDVDFLLTVSDDDAYQNAIVELALSASAVAPVAPNQPFLGPLALHVGIGQRSGYVTLALNNSTNAEQNIDPELRIYRVAPRLHRGEIKEVRRDDWDSPLSEKLTLRFNGDFAGRVDDYVFEWRSYPAISDPPADRNLWSFFPVPARTDGGPDGLGAVEITLEGGLTDQWFSCRYRPANAPNHPWSEWTEQKFAPGWIKRALFGLSLFEKRFDEIWDTVISSESVVSRAGPPFNGRVPFNKEAVDKAGLIQLYATVLQRGINLSLRGTPPVIYDPVGNLDLYQALILAASRLGDLYMLHGHEAYADAADPTIGIGADTVVEASSMFCFQDQAEVPTLLTEELALLRGRTSGGTSLQTYPVFNRLLWNVGTGDRGEVAYVNNYSIRLSGNTNTLVTPNEAELEYPQGHGDAWGHYLSASKGYYHLLVATNFAWVTTNEFVSVAGLPDQAVNYMYERKFAAVAAAKAKTGAEIVNLTYRERYEENPELQYRGYPDANTERGWGVAEWGSRSGQAAFFDWVVATGLLPPQSTNTGIQRVDRESVRELAEIASSFETIQEKVDQADLGLNPLGLAKNVVPFGISPQALAQGKTHFVQIYERAVSAMNGAIAVFNYANQATQMLRRQEDNQADFSRNAEEREADFNNRMIEIFGAPYAEDFAQFGGLYPTGYQGPDIYHFAYVDTSELLGIDAPASRPLTAQVKELDVQPDGSLVASNRTVTFNFSFEGYSLVKPPGWAMRPIPGELQRGLSDLLQARLRLERGVAEYDNLLAQIEDQTRLMQAQFNLDAQEIQIRTVGAILQQSLNDRIKQSRERQTGFRTASRAALALANAAAEALPQNITILGGDMTSVYRGAILLGGATAAGIADLMADMDQLAELDAQQAKEEAAAATELQLISLRANQTALSQLAQLQQLVRQEPVMRLELYSLNESLQQTAGLHRAALARGMRLLEEFQRFRQHTADKVRAYRYRDLAFRVFRNDALQKYRAQFDLAAMYVYLAAMAFDYESCLLNTHQASGARFLKDIVGKRAIGTISNGQPLPAGSHDPGLAGSMNALKAAYDNYDDNVQLDQGVTRERLFSLRGGWFRIGQGTGANEVWKETLRRHRVSDIWDIPEFRRYCIPPRPRPATGEPGIVIEFPSTIQAALNYFGWPAGGGEESRGYNPTFFATRIRSIGVWFSNYDSTTQGTDPDPDAWLVPAGADLLRPPGGDNFTFREWQVVDQVLPASRDLSGISGFGSNWIPLRDALDAVNGTFAAIRRYNSVDVSHDNPQQLLNTQKVTTDSLLVGRSVANTRWLLIIPGIGLFGADPNEGLERFINGARIGGQFTGVGVTDIKIYFETTHHSGN